MINEMELLLKRYLDRKGDCLLAGEEHNADIWEGGVRAINACIEIARNSLNTIERNDSGGVEVKPDSQQTKVANCHLWEVGKQCEYVVGWVCLNQCCAIPPISNRL